MTLQLKRWIDKINHKESLIYDIPDYFQYGKLVRATGMVMEAIGLQLPIGSTCFIEKKEENSITNIECEVVGFNGQNLFLMPLEGVDGICPGARVHSQDLYNSKISTRLLPIGYSLLGRVLNSSGKFLDKLPVPKTYKKKSLYTKPINPLLRDPIKKVLDVGVRAINGLLTVGIGQRMGIFSGSGVGKSILLGMMAKYTKADIIVVGLIGERGREVKDFIENILGEKGISRSVVIAAPADVSPMLRIQGAIYATRIAEYFRDKGKHVLLIMDSLTRYAMAQREISLAIGEPPATKGYPPSVFAKLSELVERTGNGTDNKGSITAFYTVLTEGDDQQDPIADSSRSILDGHIVLSRFLSESGHYPSIDIESSISRTMSNIVTESHFKCVQKVKQLISSYQKNRDLLSVGAYSSGSDPILDIAIKNYPKIEKYLKQDLNQSCSYEESCLQLNNLCSNNFNI
ncbi:fliI [Wigglesworthia glossinidia endosymbiont of Glossina brevipalpis]|uniref:Flagellum-specific ATP synthase n=1 Tax=Wigglesworthia glossinidia brevipalpis TaxID=36870 RepID=Q8D3E4_WIGBR|nr:fliI [Wigglesworthia glossinidia endosymbiont of Glossina brevipalpis]